MSITTELNTEEPGQQAPKALNRDIYSAGTSTLLSTEVKLLHTREYVSKLQAITHIYGDLAWDVQDVNFKVNNRNTVIK